jgi:hypothetical protein
MKQESHILEKGQTPEKSYSPRPRPKSVQKMRESQVLETAQTPEKTQSPRPGPKSVQKRRENQLLEKAQAIEKAQSPSKSQTPEKVHTPRPGPKSVQKRRENQLLEKAQTIEKAQSPAKSPTPEKAQTPRPKPKSIQMREAALSEQKRPKPKRVNLSPQFESPSSPDASLSLVSTPKTSKPPTATTKPSSLYFTPTKPTTTTTTSSTPNRPKTFQEELSQALSLTPQDIRFNRAQQIFKEFLTFCKNRKLDAKKCDVTWINIFLSSNRFKNSDAIIGAIPLIGEHHCKMVNICFCFGETILRLN